MRPPAPPENGPSDPGLQFTSRHGAPSLRPTHNTYILLLRSGRPGPRDALIATDTAAQFRSDLYATGALRSRGLQPESKRRPGSTYGGGVRLRRPRSGALAAGQ